ncbi:MAG: hypothetical protein WBM83_04975, partial [Flavobacteriaceae bacterium]
MRTNYITRKTRVLICLLITSSIMALGQETGLAAKVKEIQLSTPADVTGIKLSFKQEVISTSSGYLECHITEINDKGNSVERIFSFGLSDINENSIRSFTDGALILVEFRTKANQKLIKRSLDNGNKIDYVGDFVMYARNAENGRSLKKAFEDAIPVAEEVERRGLNLNSYEDHLQWLEEHISNVALPKEEIGQKLTAERSRPGAVVLERIRGPKNEKFAFNLSQLNPSTIRYDVSGALFSIDVALKNNVRGVKFTYQDVPKDFVDRVTFYASSMANGKKIQTVLKSLAPLAEQYVERAEPQFSAITQSTDYLNEHIAQVALAESSISQKIVLEDNVATISTTQPTPKRTLEHEYIFDITDINARGINYRNDGAMLFLELHTNNGQPLIRHIENGEARNFMKYIRIYFDSMDEARIAKNAFSYLIDKNDAKQRVKSNVSDLAFYDGLEELKNTIRSVDAGEIQYNQSIDLLNRAMSAITFTKVISEPKKSAEFTFEFSTRDINRNNIRMEVSGNRVWVVLSTQSAQKSIKLFRNGEV